MRDRLGFLLDEEPTLDFICAQIQKGLLGKDPTMVEEAINKVEREK